MEKKKRRAKKDFENFNGMVLYREKRAARKCSLITPLNPFRLYL